MIILETKIILLHAWLLLSFAQLIFGSDELMNAVTLMNAIFFNEKKDQEEFR